MKKALKRFLAMSCTAALLLTTSGVMILADEMQEEKEVLSDISENESVPEEDIQDYDDEDYIDDSAENLEEQVPDNVEISEDNYIDDSNKDFNHVLESGEDEIVGDFSVDFAEDLETESLVGANQLTIEQVRNWLNNEIRIGATRGSGECVDFCNYYLKDCWGIAAIGGHAYMWKDKCPSGWTPINLNKSYDNCQIGDLIVEDINPNAPGYGHVSVYYGKENGKHYVVDQNNLGRRYAGKGRVWSDFSCGVWCFRPPILNSTPTGTLDVNGLLDGRESGNTDYYGNFQVYINGNKVTSHPYSDYYNANLKPGDTYEIREIKADPGKIYIGNSSISGTIRANETTTVTLRIDSAANIGDDFYAVILNKEIWKPISLNTETHKVTLETEKAVAYQKWRFVRQGDGSYLIMSCYDGKVLEMTDGIRTNGTQLSAPSDDWGGAYQRWYLFRYGGAYMIRCAHYQDEEWVMNLSYGSSVDGTNINICKRNNSNAQVFSIYYDYDVQLKGVSLQATVNNNEVTFDWDRIYGAVSYNLKIWKDELWEGDAYKIINDAASGTSLLLEEGSYIAYVDSVDFFQNKMSNTVNITINHVPKDISKCTVTLSTTSYAYNGSTRIPSVTVKLGTTILTSGTDYIVSYTNNINAGTATATITGKNNYTGTITKTFTIAKAAPTLKFASASVKKTSLDASFTNELTKNTDGTVTFKSSDTNVATVNSTSGAITIKGIGTATITATATSGKNYKAGSANYTLTVIDGRIDISKCTVTLSATSYTYNGKANKPTVTVKKGTQSLTSGTDYTVAYSNNTNAGTATVTVTGTGNCIGTNSTTFKINKAAPKLTFASESVSKTISDDAFKNELTKTTDGTVALSSSDTNVATVNSTTGIVTIRGAGTVTITAAATAGKNYKAGSASYTLNVSGISLENATVGGVSLSYGYSGKAYTPTVTVKVDGVTLTKDTDYAVKYENNQNPGTATITVTGKGKYSGTKTKTFEIVDCVSSVVSGKTYLLIPKNNSKTAVCAVGGKMVNNTKVYITDRGNSESQKFKAVKNSDGTWKFINSKCELALAVQQNSSELGAGLVLYDQTTKPAQNWKLSKKSDNSFAIINSVTGYSIAMSDKSAVKGTTLSMAETASVGLQRFYIVETSAVSAPFDGTNSIRAAKDQSFAVNIASSSKEDGANVSLYTYTNSNARKFKIIYSGGGYYRLVNVNSGLCLTIKDNSDADGANIIQSKWKGFSSQRWKITKNSDGSVTITNMLGTVLHLLGNRTVNNTNIHARKAASTTAQKWYLQ